MSIVNKFFGIWKTSSKMMMKKNENYKELILENYTLKFYYKPALFFEDGKLKEIYSTIEKINSTKSSIKNGILKNFDFFKKSSENIFLCVFYLKQEPVGFFYNYVFEFEKKVISHQGTFICNKNTGVDIVNMISPLLSVFLYEKVGGFYITTITQVPAIAEALIENTSYTYPSPERMKGPKPFIKKIFNFSVNHLKDIFLEEGETIKVDEKTFKVQIENTKSAYKELFDLSFSKKLKYNLFLNFLIDYKKNEFIFFVSQYDKNCNNKNKKLFFYYFY